MSHSRGAGLDGLRVAVIGAGAVGLCLAVRLARFGALTQLFDPSDAREEASGIAAGMLAPIGEALFDDPQHLPLWRAAAECWPPFAQAFPALAIETCGARFPDISDALRELGVTREERGFSTREDARLDAWPALAALEDAFQAAGGERRRLRLETVPEADLVVIAAGFASRRFADLAPELSALTPIKGQLLRFQGGPAEGPIIRSSEGYLVPSEYGAVVGATMEPGLDDRQPTEVARTRLLAVADSLHPGLAKIPHQILAGVRAATPDGLPMVGPSTRKGVFIATGMRRNGWLLAPLVSEMILAYLSGGEVGPFAAALDPRRFARS